MRAVSRVGWRILLSGCALTACGGSGDTVTVRGDVEGLDTIALRGDSLLARSTRQSTYLDSMRLMLDGPAPVARGAASDSGTRGAVAGTSAAATVPTPSVEPAALAGVNERTARARARGDSMARAEAQRFANAMNGTVESGGDTVRGVLTLVGVEPARQVVLRTPSGSMVSLSGMATTGMAKLAGTELVIRGVKVTPRDVVVRDYFVRASNGVPAFDGRLNGDAANGYWLQLSDGSGRRRLASLPAPLQGLAGARVWIALKPGTSQPTAYGVIAAR